MLAAIRRKDGQNNDRGVVTRILSRRLAALEHAQHRSGIDACMGSAGPWSCPAEWYNQDQLPESGRSQARGDAQRCSRVHNGPTLGKCPVLPQRHWGHAMNKIRPAAYGQLTLKLSRPVNLGSDVPG